eukprot:Nk52_evm89s164 gene=Nk52_evmTU89s164
MGILTEIIPQLEEKGTPPDTDPHTLPHTLSESNDIPTPSSSLSSAPSESCYCGVSSSPSGIPPMPVTTPTPIHPSTPLTHFITLPLGSIPFMGTDSSPIPSPLPSLIHPSTPPSLFLPLTLESTPFMDPSGPNSGYVAPVFSQTFSSPFTLTTTSTFSSPCLCANTDIPSYGSLPKTCSSSAYEPCFLNTTPQAQGNDKAHLCSIAGNESAKSSDENKAPNGLLDKVEGLQPNDEENKRHKIKVKGIKAVHDEKDVGTLDRRICRKERNKMASRRYRRRRQRLLNSLLEQVGALEKEQSEQWVKSVPVGRFEAPFHPTRDTCWDASSKDYDYLHGYNTLDI